MKVIDAKKNLSPSLEMEMVRSRMQSEEFINSYQYLDQLLKYLDNLLIEFLREDKPGLAINRFGQQLSNLRWGSSDDLQLADTKKNISGLLNLQRWVNQMKGYYKWTAEYQSLWDNYLDMQLKIWELRITHALRVTSEIDKNRDLIAGFLLDDLTGLPKREMVEMYLSNAVDTGVLNHSPEVSVVMLDIDFFSIYNDSYSHNFGDLVLSNLGKFLMSQTADFTAENRAIGWFEIVEDMISSFCNEKISLSSDRSLIIPMRYAGEEFCFLLVGFENQQVVDWLKSLLNNFWSWQDIKSKLVQNDQNYDGPSFDDDKRQLPFSCSIGLASTTITNMGEGSKLEWFKNLQEKADQALLVAKGGGGVFNRGHMVHNKAMPGQGSSWQHHFPPNWSNALSVRRYYEYKGRNLVDNDFMLLVYRAIERLVRGRVLEQDTIEEIEALVGFWETTGCKDPFWQQVIFPLIKGCVIEK